MIYYKNLCGRKYFVYDCFISVDYSLEDPDYIRFCLMGSVLGESDVPQVVELEVFKNLNSAKAAHMKLSDILDLTRTKATTVVAYEILGNT